MANKNSSKVFVAKDRGIHERRDAVPLIAPRPIGVATPADVGIRSMSQEQVHYLSLGSRIIFVDVGKPVTSHRQY